MPDTKQENIARHKLAKWSQRKDVVNFNNDFLKVILDISDISLTEQMDCYTRRLKPEI